MKQKKASRMIAVFVLAVLLGLAGCGIPANGGANSGATPPGNSATPSPTPTPGQVRIILDKATYGIKDNITVSVANGLAASIYSAPRYTNCTVVSLQWQSGTSWVPWGRCLIEQTAHLTQLKANSITTLRLDPTTNMTISGISRPGAPKTPATTTWQLGTYRIVFSFNTLPDEGNPGGIVIESATFTVK